MSSLEARSPWRTQSSRRSDPSLKLTQTNNKANELGFNESIVRGLKTEMQGWEVPSGPVADPAHSAYLHSPYSTNERKPELALLKSAKENNTRLT